MGKVHYKVVTTYYKVIRAFRGAVVEPSPKAIRTAADAFASLYPMPMNTRLELTTIGKCRCGVITHRTPRSKDLFIFIHGGGFAFGSVKTHRVAIAHLCKMTGMTGYIPEYRLSPEFCYPTPLDDCMSTYEELCKSFPNQKIYLMGDSAGGNLAAAMVHRMVEKGLKLPEKLILMSPWLDLSPNSVSIQNNRDEDSLFDKNDLIHYSEFYVKDADVSSPDVSPLQADVSEFPPTLIQVAKNELLYYDSKLFEEKLKNKGREVVLSEEPMLFHSWQLFPDFVPEAHKSLRQAADFINGTLSMRVDSSTVLTAEN